MREPLVQKCRTFALFSIAVLFCLLSPVIEPARSDTETPRETLPAAVSWWTGDGTADDKLNVNHGVVLQSLRYENGKVGRAFSFDGQGARISLQDSPSLRLTRSMTIEGWLWIDTTTRHGMVLFRGDDRSALDSYYVYVSPDKKLRFAITSETQFIEVDADVVWGEWLHVAAVLDDATDRLAIYINGALANEIFTKIRPLGNLDPGSNPGIGIGNTGAIHGTPHSHPYHGLIDELTIYAAPLTPSQILQIYSAGSKGKVFIPPAPVDGAPTTPPLVATTPNALGKIAFHSNRDGNDEIYLMFADGSSQQRLTNNAANDGGAIISPTGTQIAFTSNRDGNLEAYSMNFDGSNQLRLTNHAASDIASSWSPNGQYLAFYSNRNGNYDIFLTDAEGAMLKPLTDNSEADDIEPAFSPDGNRIAFCSKRDGNYEIYTMDANGKKISRLTKNTVADREPSWSPDGRKIIWSRREGERNQNIYIMNADGSEEVCLTDYNGKDVRPSFSADGKKIVFASDRNGNMEIYAMDVDGANVTRLTNNLAGDLDPYAASALLAGN